ncbi:histone-fold-containing protein [Thozetella sp. PMI_491]|nr:histone-fold-containing protein [Thozetella sp. PMI_491]
MSGDGSYAPKSPDLSSFYSSGPTQPPPPPQSPQQPLYQRPGSQHSPSHFSPAGPPGPHLQPKSASAYYPPPTSGSSPQIHTQHLPPNPGPLSGGGYSLSPASQQYYSPIQQQPQQQPQTQLLQSAQFAYSVPSPTAQHQHPPPYYQPYQGIPAQPGFLPHQQQPPIPVHHGYAPPVLIKEDPDTKPADIMPPRKAAGASAAPPRAEIDPSPVRTKFPTARIKRIMQADEEVGKVAQQTPIAVGKALELFMVALVTKSADVAREKNSKRISAQMLKQVVESDDQWDFLREIVGRVENDESGGKSKGRAPKPESESEEEPVEKKKGRGGRKKKAA